jgi:VWFA-related protein
LLQEPNTLKVDVPVVSVDVTVVDSKGTLVNNLTKSDFEIYEDGIAQEVRFFSPVSTPYNVFLLFDSSDSTRDNLDFMVQAAAELIVNLRPEDKLAIASFDDDFKSHLAWSTDRTKAMTALRQMIQPHKAMRLDFMPPSIAPCAENSKAWPADGLWSFSPMARTRPSSMDRSVTLSDSFSPLESSASR